MSIIERFAIVTGASPSSIGFLAAQKLAVVSATKLSSSPASPNTHSGKDDGRNDLDVVNVIVLACRDETKGMEAQKRITESIAAVGVDMDGRAPAVKAVYFHLDLSSFESIHNFVDKFHEMIKSKDIRKTSKQNEESEVETVEGRLKILINNAGVGFGRDTPFHQTKDGLEEIVGVNHFGTFLLTQLLLDDLQNPLADDKSVKNDESRIVIVSSSLHGKVAKSTGKEEGNKEGREDIPLILPAFPDGILQTEPDEYDGFLAYKVSKLCNLMFNYELQRILDNGEQQQKRIKKNTVKCVAISPGFIPTTGLSRRAGWLGTFFLHYVLDPWRYLGLGITRSPEDGAETIVQAATSPSVSKGGQYFHLPKGETSIVAIHSSDESLDEEKARILWELSMRTCKLL